MPSLQCRCHSFESSMLLQDLNGKTVCVLGYGKEGKATVKALEEYAPESEITVADKNDELQIANCKVQLGESLFSMIWIVLTSLSNPPEFLRVFLQSAICNLQSSPTPQRFFEEAAARGATVVGVTGSKGKSTTSTLIHEILKAGDKKSLRGEHRRACD